ncbi:MAG TPA: GNAT family N-acetyltransferase [Fibrobacteraceae bacterium]|nr:GNAT family N-acetyltransferase [Fibrobacteraceae bacterium]
MILPAADDTDLAPLTALASEIWWEHFPPIIGEAQVRYMVDRFQSATAMRDQMIHGYEYYFLENGHAARCGYFCCKNDQDRLFLSKLYVHKDFRKQGHARAAIQYMSRLAQERNLRAIHLTVNKNNAASIAAYQKLGFQQTGSVTTPIGEGFVMDDYTMELQIPVQSSFTQRTEYP